MATRTAVNREIRGFAFVWIGITLIIGVATFFAIYLTYGDEGNGILNQGISLPVPPEQAAAVVNVTLSATPVPILIPSATPKFEGVAVAQALEQDTSAQDMEPTPLPIDQEDFVVGVQVQASISLDSNIQESWMNDVHDLGLNWYKQQVRWQLVEPEPGQYDWSMLDLSLNTAAEKGIQVMLSVVTTPDWARQEGVSLDHEGPPADYQDYVNFITAMLKRYPGQIHAIEVWNEQNIDREWMSPDGLSAADYVELLRVTYQAIKENDPGIIVISGALAPTGGWVDNGIVTAIDDFDFMDQMISAGLLNYTDCVGAHHNGYNIGPSVTWDAVPNDPDAVFRGPFDNPHHSWSFRSTLQTYANKIAVAGGNQRLCVTEFGWPSVEDLEDYPQNFEFALDNTLEEQATYTIEAIENMEEWDIVWIAFIWNLNYGPQMGWDSTNDNTPYSLIGPEWVRRPAYEAIKAWSAESTQ